MLARVSGALGYKNHGTKSQEKVQHGFPRGLTFSSLSGIKRRDRSHFSRGTRAESNLIA